ncbi:serine protease FAM111A-like [Alosa pseudoharengus]|uniref:serine protease FAM111A-like n=1 Tax=Alosa pseudoharengus TaxID=34774 RepID=UPI003F8C7843
MAKMIAPRSLVKVKKENAEDHHPHRIIVKFHPPSIPKKQTIDCCQLNTVLEAIKSNEKVNEMIKCADENIIIQMGREDKKYIVATHFPCSCIKNNECLTISCKSEAVEKAPDQHDKTIYPKDRYSVFYIDKVGGLNAKQKVLFRSTCVKEYKYLCVYGEKEWTVEEALRRDGRFIDDLGDFSLSNNEDAECLTYRTQTVVNLNQKEFKIRLPRRKKTNKENAGNPSLNSQSMREPRSVTDVAHQRGISVKTAVEKGDRSIEEIYEELRKQYPDLKKWLDSRFSSSDSYQKALDLRKENFGKIQQSFSEVHRVRMLLKLGTSVGKIIVQNVCCGTCFVLFDSLVLTNAHLFKDHFEGKELHDIKVFVLFNYEDPQPSTNFQCFTCVNTLVDIDVKLDYAILEFDPQNKEGPTGLLKNFGKMPQTGEACIIGHPAGEVKKMDPTFIIAKEKRADAVNAHLDQYKGTMFILLSISQTLKNKGIENIMMNTHDPEIVTYNTFMYHGSSGSPVFDTFGKVFGLHTAGCTYGFPNHEESVIEFAHPLLKIFERFVRNLEGDGNKELLEKVEKAAKGNEHLEKVLKAADCNEPMDIS